MQIQSDLCPMFSYSKNIIIIFFLITLFLFNLLRLKKRKKVIKVVIPDKKSIYNIKNNYLIKLDNLLNDINNNKINNRNAYQFLSNLIRNFVYETTNIKLQNYTLTDIEKTNLPNIYELVSEYYDPEFSKISKGNINSSIEKTRKVIEKWN